MTMGRYWELDATRVGERGVGLLKGQKGSGFCEDFHFFIVHIIFSFFRITSPFFFLSSLRYQAIIYKNVSASSRRGEFMTGLVIGSIGP